MIPDLGGEELDDSMLSSQESLLDEELRDLYRSAGSESTNAGTSMSNLSSASHRGNPHISCAGLHRTVTVEIEITALEVNAILSAARVFEAEGSDAYAIYEASLQQGSAHNSVAERNKSSIPDNRNRNMSVSQFSASFTQATQDHESNVSPSNRLDYSWFLSFHIQMCC